MCIRDRVCKDTMQSNQNGNASLFSALKHIDLSAFDSVVVGPGIGIDGDDWQKSKDFLISYGGLLILDADALNRISESKLRSNFFLKRKFKTWITPHSREFSRLFPNIKGVTNIKLALNAAKDFNISVLLKGANSIVADNKQGWQLFGLSLIHISEPTRLLSISYAVFCLKKKKQSETF